MFFANNLPDDCNMSTLPKTPTTEDSIAYGIQLRTDIQQVFIDHPLLVTLVDAKPSP